MESGGLGEGRVKVEYSLYLSILFSSDVGPSMGPPGLPLGVHFRTVKVLQEVGLFLFDSKFCSSM